MSATPTDKHCIEWCSGCVEWCSMAASSTHFTLQLLRRHPRRGIATANIQHFFYMGKEKYKKYAKWTILHILI